MLVEYDKSMNDKQSLRFENDRLYQNSALHGSPKYVMAMMTLLRFLCQESRDVVDKTWDGQRTDISV